MKSEKEMLQLTPQKEKDSLRITPKSYTATNWGKNVRKKKWTGLCTHNNSSKLRREGMDNPNRPKTKTEPESVIKTFPTKKSLGPEGSTADLYQTFKEKLIPMINKLFKMMETGITRGSRYGSLSPTNKTWIERQAPALV